MIQIDSLRVDYGRFTAVDDLSLEIPRGSIFGLVGPNGAGKTSTIKVLSTLMEPTYGTVKICGLDVESDPAGVREKLGYMPDLAPVISNLKVWEFLDHFARCHGFSETKRRRDRIDECLHQVKLTDARETYCKALSRGMTQRVVLAKTLIHEPDVFLLDEPASGMDPMARIDLRDLLQSLSKAGKTVLISSHILTELSEMCTDIGLIHKGRLSVAGTVDEVLSSVDTRQRLIRIGFLGEAQPILDFLGTIKSVEESLCLENGVEVRFAGSPEDQSVLLKKLITSGFQITAFEPKRAGLEDLMRKVSGES